jgi:hypothetical protein
LIACGGDLLRPRYSPQVTAALVVVGYPAPPARVEFIPAKPQKGSVWIDGEWAWEGSKWAWTPGRWVTPPSGATYSPWTTVRDDQGTVYFASGVWKDASGQALPPPVALASGRERPGSVTSSEGDEVKTAPKPANSGSPLHDGAPSDAHP